MFRHIHFKLLCAQNVAETNSDLSGSVLLSVSSVPWCVAPDMTEVWKNIVVQKSFHSNYNINVIWDNMTALDHQCYSVSHDY